jgi:hypothetical protein
MVLNANGKRTEIDKQRRQFSRLLVPGGLITEERGITPPAMPVESETIEQYIEE